MLGLKQGINLLFPWWKNKHPFIVLLLSLIVHLLLIFRLVCQADLVLQVLQDFSDGLQTQMLLPNLHKRQKVSASLGFKRERETEPIQIINISQKRVAEAAGG